MTDGVFYWRSSAFIRPPTGFALERLRDAKRVYEKTTSGRAHLVLARNRAVPSRASVVDLCRADEFFAHEAAEELKREFLLLSDARNSRYERSEPVVGCIAHSRRTAQVRGRSRTIDRRRISSSPAEAAFPDLA